MRILIAGGSGYLGSQIIRQLGAHHDFINLSLSRQASGAVNDLLLDLSRPIGFLKLDKPVDMIINCVECHPDRQADGAKKEYLAAVNHLLAFAKANQIPRFMHFSVNNIDTVENNYQQAKFVAEGIVEHTGLEHIIFKPSIIFGSASPLDRLVEAVLSRPVMPRFWSKEAMISPVHISDVLKNIEYALAEPSCWNQTYSLCGPEYMGVEEMLLRNAPSKPRFLATPEMATRTLLKSLFKEAPNRHLRVLLDWIATDNVCQKSPLIRPKTFY